MTTRYLLTGGAGFIGSHMAERLLARGDFVVALDDLSTGRMANVEHLLPFPGFRFVHGSVLDERAVDEAVRAADVVVHLAAAVGVKLVVEQPLQSFTTNLRGSEIVLDAATRHQRKVMVASTSEIYGKAGGPLSETTDRILGPPSVARWAYSVAKSVDEILAFAYHRERALPVIIVRLFNTVGPRQSPAYGMVMPRLIQQALAGQPLTVFGDGTQTRCFCHVSDVVQALIALLKDPRAVGEAFNVGSNDEISILDLARRIIDQAGSTSPIRFVPYDEAYGVGIEDMDRRVPDTRKLHDLTGWSPTSTLEDVLEETIADTRRNLERAFIASGRRSLGP